MPDRSPHDPPSESQIETLPPVGPPDAFRGTGVRLSPGSHFGPYRIERLLGKGGMGEVYEAEDLDNGRRVALKVLARRLGGEADRLRFLREGRLAAAVNHPHTVYVFGTEDIHGVPVISMELATGGTLRDLVASNGPLRPSAAVDAILQAIDGLDAAYRAGVLHRDVKPSNCFIEEDGRIKIGDFGLSISTLADNNTNLTRQGTVLGTPAFAAPEQLRGEAIDVRADIYAVAATLFYLLTGRPPFDESNLMKLLTFIAQQRPDAVDRIRRDVPAALARVVQRGLSKRPQDRFATYAAFREALRPFSSASPTPATLALRVIAGAIDQIVVIGTASATIAALTEVTADRGWLRIVLALALPTAYFAVTEGRWGASLGKALCGLRVVDTDGQPPLPPRVALRALLFSALGMTPLLWRPVVRGFLRPLEPSPDFVGSLAIVIMYALTFAAFITARRSNGFAGIHELLSATRVVTSTTARTGQFTVSTPPDPMDLAGTAMIGPYHVVRTYEGALRLGFDPALRRFVWVRMAASTDPPIPAVRRDLGRPTRTRWLSGRRSDSESWDAFAAVDGAPLELIAQHDWSVIREWLHDLGEELCSGIREGNLPDLSLDRVWIGTDRRVRLLDWPAPGASPQPAIATTPVEMRGAQTWLHAVFTAASARSSGKGTSAILLPHSARRVIDAWRDASLGSVEALRDSARALVHGPARVTRMRRAVPLIVTLLPVVYIATTAISASRALTRARTNFTNTESHVSITSLLLASLPVIVELLAVFATLTVLSALMFGTGPLSRALGMALVTRNGTPARRGRTALRALVTWLPVIVVFLITNMWGWLYVGFRLPEPGSWGQALALVCTATFIVGAALAVSQPARGPQDRIAGTWLVPR
jgi:uncharacterized RDD family membrane protein YckC